MLRKIPYSPNLDLPDLLLLKLGRISVETLLANCHARRLDTVTAVTDQVTVTLLIPACPKPVYEMKSDWQHFDKAWYYSFLILRLLYNVAMSCMAAYCWLADQPLYQSMSSRGIEREVAAVEVGGC